MYLDELADEIRRGVPPEALPDGDTTLLFRLYALLVRAKGRDVSVHDVHDAWAAWMATVDPSHDALKPFEQLDRDTQSGDDPYVQAIRDAATQRTE